MKIHKYTANDQHPVRIVKMPTSAKIICAKLIRKSIVFWAEVDSLEPTVSRYFEVVGTGRTVPENSQYRETFFDGPYVWHLYEIIK